MLPPDQIGLLVGVPTTLDEFKQRVGRSDFLSRYALSPDNSTPSNAYDRDWSEHYGPMIGMPLHDLVDAARGMNIRVSPCAGLADVYRLSADCRVVIVIAHWKGSEILFEDLHPNCTMAAIVERASRGHSLLAGWLLAKARGDRPRPSLLGRRKPPTVPALLREAVQVGWDGERARVSVDGRSALSITLAARRRQEMDEMLEGLIQPGNRIELFDGLHAKEAFESALAPGFSGFLDLTSCTSTILGDYVSQKRRAALRLLEFPEEQELLWHAHCVLSALEMTIHGGEEYPDARVLAEGAMKQALLELALTRCISHPTGRSEESP